MSIDLKKCLTDDPVDRPKPLNFHERTNQILPAENNLLQYYLSDTEDFTTSNLMKINNKKSKVMLFNKSRKWDFPPEVGFSDKNNLFNNCKRSDEERALSKYSADWGW